MSVPQFSIVPIEVLMDERLSKNDIRVLCAILAFRDKNTNVSWPSRDSLSAILGMPVCKISTVTTKLARLGWITKHGNGGRSKACRYQFHVPETVTESDTVTETVTVTDSVTKTVTDSVTKTVTETVTGIEQTNEQTNEQTKDRRASKSRLSGLDSQNSKTPQRPTEVSQKCWDKFIAHRQSIGKPLTRYALNRIRSQAGKAGMTLEDVLNLCVRRDWRSFNADWVREQQRQSAPRDGFTHTQDDIEALKAMGMRVAG